MKTVKTTLLVATLALISTAVFATGNLKANMEQAGADKAIIAASNMKVESFEIELEDQYGKTIFSKTTEADANYQKKYDFSALEDGIYRLSVTHGSEYYTKRFQLESGDVTVLEERKIAEPFFTQYGDHVKMSYLNFPKEDVSIYVYDSNDLLHKQKLGSEFAINKAIDLTELRSGYYTIVLASGFDVFEHDVAID